MENSHSKRWYTVIMLALVYACSQMDRQIMSILLDPIAKDLGASDTQMGLLVGIYFALFYTFFAIPIAMIADRTNRKNVIALSVVVWSALTAVCGAVTSYFQMALARMGVAFGEAGSTPASISIISDLFDEKSRTSAIAVFIAGASVGALFAFLCGGILLDKFGWRMTFVLIGLPGILLGLIVFLTVKEPKKAISKDSSANAAGLGETISFMAKQAALRHVLIGKILGGFVGYGLALWVPTFLYRSYGLTGTQVGLTLAAFAVIGVIGTLASGRIIDHFAKNDERWRAWIICFAKLISLPFLATFFFIDQLSIALILYAIPSFFGSFYLAPSAALIQNLVKIPMRTVAAAVSLFLLNIIGLGLGPLVVGIGTDALAPKFGDEALRYTLSAFIFVNLLAVFHFWRAGVLLGKTVKNSSANEREA